VYVPSFLQAFWFSALHERPSGLASYAPLHTLWQGLTATLTATGNAMTFCVYMRGETAGMKPDVPIMAENPKILPAISVQFCGS
jgi:hypothetical protein